MRKLALAILLILSTGCDFAGYKILPYIEYSEGGRASLGYDRQTNMFRQNSDEPTWTVGVGFSIPLGKPQKQEIELADWMPRYPLPVVLRESGHRPHQETGKPVEATTAEKVQDIIEDPNKWIPYAAALGIMLIIVVVLVQLGLIKKKNGKKKPE